MALVGAAEKLDSHNLRDFLRIKDDDRRANLDQSTSTTVAGGSRHSPSGITLLAILSERRSTAPEPAPPTDEPPLQSVQSNRTLLDIIREDQTSGPRDGRRSWRQLREKIGLRTRGGSAWSSTAPVLLGGNHREMMVMTRRPSTRFDLTDSTLPGPSPGRSSERFENLGSPQPQRAEPPVRMSLMALLAENDRQMRLESSACVSGDGRGEVEDSVAVGGGGGYNGCCVCMVRHKGAAFIPCGHTFCRLCSRELWVQRGNCPLCNNYILEILDIF
ncbi:RING/U-box superfamily protein [Striga hermonthica]|uniref:RING/U-box superfamily protein n=1 Tax=Striga hermonthica TaxID=68872 RepID=A0A9N7NZ70_STRHE|nr:RING/U-box superfamily protein [Striga hermonthica]